MNKKKGLFFTALVIALTSLLCLGLYRYDNKYTRPDIQPINGILFYPEGNGLCYLTRQWVVYPDVLLTPDTVEGYSGYRHYGDIGSTNDKGHQITYRLTLVLPDTPSQYALEVPEIFSSSILYINDQIYAQTGNPSAAAYQEGITNRVITFTASGKTDLLLAVSDYSGVHFGLTYPPAFGSPDDVLNVRENRLLLHGGLALLAFLGALLSISFGVLNSFKKGLLSCLLSFALIVVTGYPLYHGLFVTGVQPWYTLEPLCYYAVLLLSLLLQFELYDIENRKKLLLSIPCAVGILATLLRFGCASVLPETTAAIFSGLSLLLQYYTALCLLGSSLWAVWNKKYHSILLLCGNTAMSVCLLWDRICPLYEPLYGGWFGEIGCILLVLFLTASLWMDAVDAYRFRLVYENTMQQMEKLLTLQKDHYSQLSHQIQLSREASHDLRHHMRTLYGMADTGQWTHLLDYLKEYAPHMHEREVILYSEHPTVDAVLKYHAAAAQQHNAEFDVNMAIPYSIPFPDDELCILLGNLLENAIDAVSEQTTASRHIYLRGLLTDGQLMIVLDNTFDGVVNKKHDIFLSTKHAGTGIGLQSVQTIVKKHKGLVDFDIRDGRFHVSILIPLE